jgi:hypothetical protein
MLKQGPNPVFDPELGLKAALSDLMRYRPVWPPKEALRKFSRQSLGVRPEHEDAWYRSAWWGFYAARLIAKYRVEKRFEEILDLVEEPVDWTPIEHALAEGKGVMLANAHLGTGHLAAIVAKHANFSLLEISGHGNALGREGSVAVRTDAGRKASLAQCLMHLRRKNVTLAAPDGRFGEKYLNARFLNQALKVFVGYGELARLSQAPTFWLSASWTGPDRARIILMPIATPDAVDADWLSQWYTTYLNHVAHQMRHHPADLGFYRNGLWDTAHGGVAWFNPRATGIETMSDWSDAKHEKNT